MSTAIETPTDRARPRPCDSETMLMSVLRRRDQVVPFLDKICTVLRLADYASREVLGVRLALKEAIVNGFRHGNKGDSSKWVCVSYHVTPSEFVAQIQDEGAGFDLASLNKPSGRGLSLIRRSMSSVKYSASGACVTMSKRRSRPK